MARILLWDGRGLLCGGLDAWGIPYGSDAHDVVTLVAAELCANAVRRVSVTAFGAGQTMPTPFE
ncbi:hypothetical protein ACWCY6_31745 [Streptomyces sp. 900105755]|uniref:hypothetical protein n=1 Tax=Streptomyces sp. NPDC001507 TaxID=3364579 RepID=UPI0036CDE6E7